MFALVKINSWFHYCLYWALASSRPNATKKQNHYCMRRFKSQNVLRHTIDYSTVLIIELHFNKISKVLLLFYSLCGPGQMEIFFLFLINHSLSPLLSHTSASLSFSSLSLSGISHSLPLSSSSFATVDPEWPPSISPLSTRSTCFHLRDGVRA